MSSTERFGTSLTVKVDDYRSEHHIIYECEDVSDLTSKNNFNRNNRTQSLRLPVNNNQKNKGISRTTSFVRKCLRKDSEIKIQNRPMQSTDWIVFESRVLPEPQVHRIICAEAKIELQPPYEPEKSSADVITL